MTRRAHRCQTGKNGPFFGQFGRCRIMRWRFGAGRLGVGWRWLTAICPLPISLIFDLHGHWCPHVPGYDRR